jgi:2-polyprenyl-3-methyl-5-hydroxy-6-metoxy-1,4-benzoquinol methylase
VKRKRFGLDDVTREYLAREVDSRMVEVVREHLRGQRSVLDVACGSGLYGPHLKAEVPIVYGVDHDPVLCDAAVVNRAYDRVVCDRVERSAQHFDRVDALFCSEFLEHLPTAEVGPTVRALERLVRNRVVITVPNPLSPHFKHDPTHIGRYNVYSMRRTLNSGGAFTYRLLPLGFSDLYREKLWARALDPLSSRVALLSPTVLYVGDRG